MGGRADFEERREARKLRYEELSKKAKERSMQYCNSTANRILAMTPGQPIIIGHHSEKKARRLHERAWQDIGKSIEEDKKSKYYKDRAETVENSKVIYNDDPNAIQKLKDKLEYLEKQRELIKADENHTGWQLQNIGARIRETKRRIARLEKLEELYMEDVISYLDLKSLGRDLLNQRSGKLTEYGVLCRMDEGMENSQEEEEFE